MRALLYLKKKTAVNRFKKALKHPVTYLYFALFVLYAVMIIGGVSVMTKQFQLDSVVGLTTFLTLWGFYSIPANFVSYANRKGIVFRPAQTHFVFTAPISPKRILLDSAFWNFALSILTGLLLVPAGVIWFHVPVWKMAVVFFVCFLLEAVMECSLILILYGSDRFADGKFKIWGRVIKCILLASVAFLLFYFKQAGVSLESLNHLLNAPLLRMIPVVGWNIGAFRLILLGVDLYNVIGMALYLLLAVLLLFLAVRMKNTGGYYEEAAKFADDYQEYRSRNKSGEAVFSIGGKKKFKKAKVRFQGGAKAIFARQLLEYKKERLFIFNYMTVMCIILAVILGKSWNHGGSFRGLTLLGILAYIMLLTTGYKGKWDKELKNPYLYLIPDTPFKKMWNATKMEHVKALIDGTIMSVIIGVMWKLPTWQIVMCILIYAILQANKLYMKVFAVMLLGDTVGKIGRDILRVLIQSLALGGGLLLAVAAVLLLNETYAFVILFVYSLLATAAVAFLASMKFDVLEQTD